MHASRADGATALTFARESKLYGVARLMSDIRDRDARDARDASSTSRYNALNVTRTEPPVDFMCPILHAPMSDPVVTSSGATFERSAIERWLETSQMCPLTKVRISSVVYPNTVLKRRIEEYETEVLARMEEAHRAAIRDDGTRESKRARVASVECTPRT